MRSDDVYPLLATAAATACSGVGGADSIRYRVGITPCGFSRDGGEGGDCCWRAKIIRMAKCGEPNCGQPALFNRITEMQPVLLLCSVHRAIREEEAIKCGLRAKFLPLPEGEPDEVMGLEE